MPTIMHVEILSRECKVFGIRLPSSEHPRAELTSGGAPDGRRVRRRRRRPYTEAKGILR